METSNLLKKLGIGLIAGAAAFLPVYRAKADDALKVTLSSTSGVSPSNVRLIHSQSANSSSFLESPNPSLIIYASEGTNQYRSDVHGTNDYSIFHLILSGDTGNNTLMNTDASVQFNFLQQDPNLIYTAHIHEDGAYTLSGLPFDSYNIITNNTSVNLSQGIRNLPSWTEAGYIDISCRPLLGGIVKSLKVAGTNASLDAILHPGAKATPQISTNPAVGNWVDLTNLVQDVQVNEKNFNATPEDPNGIIYTNSFGTYTTNTAPLVNFSNLPVIGKGTFYRIKESTP